jgi:hypothetical protein
MSKNGGRVSTSLIAKDLSVNTRFFATRHSTENSEEHDINDKGPKAGFLE